MYVPNEDRSRPGRNFGRALMAICFLLTCHVAVWACNVPVFRFALERWRADPYRVFVFHRGPFTSEQQSLVDSLTKQAESLSTNLTVQEVDLAAEQPQADAAWFEKQPQSPLPQLVVRYPEHLQIDIPVWTAPLDQESINALLESQVRKELIRRLAEGETAVYLLLEGDSPEATDNAAGRLEAKLKQLEQELELPKLTESPADELLTAMPLRISFSIMRVRRDDPQEQPLIGMLVRAEPDLITCHDPIAYPVFGRGRALLPLVGPGITAENIYESAAFLVGPCSCEVKELNPGFDLLLTAGWDKMVYADGIASSQESPTGKEVDDSSQVEMVPIPTGARKAMTHVPDPNSTAGLERPAGPDGSASLDGTSAPGGLADSRGPFADVTRHESAPGVPYRRLISVVLIAVVFAGILAFRRAWAR